ncbi:hypothetical protein FCV25MIE_10054 [Fagus crenata]
MKKSWSVFSNLCKGFWDNNPLRGQATSANRRQVEFWDVETHMGMEGSLSKISHADHNSVTTTVNTVLGDFQNTDTDVNAHILLELKLELTRGQDGRWAVSKAEVENKAQTKEPLRGPKQTQQKSKKQNGPTKMWKPKSAPLQPSNGAFQGKGVAEGVDRLWGSSLTWMLELRDGRRVSIPISLLCMPTSIDTEENDSEEGASSHDDEVSVVWEDLSPSNGEGKLIYWEDENKPLKVAPLAIAGPDVDEMIIEATSAQEFEQVSGFKPFPSK